jgi:protein TonB
MNAMKTQVSSWTVSIAAHVAVASALLFGLPFFTKPIVAKEKFQGVEVLLMASAPPMDASPPPQPLADHAPPPPPPEPIREPEPITSTSAAPDVEPAPPPKPKPLVQRPPKPQPPKPQAEQVKAPVEPAAPAAEPVPEKLQIAAAPTAPPGPVMAAPRVTVNPNAEASYYAALLAWLERHKEYPRRAQLRRMEGVAHLRFTIDGHGRVIRHRIERSSGHDTLDDAVERMIAKASPLPPIPATLGKDSLDVVVPIQFFLK